MLKFKKPVLFRRANASQIKEQKVPLKFRGKIKGTDKYVYGWYSEFFNSDGEESSRIFYDSIYPDEFEEVEKDSVAQLVGYDRCGEEIYEGDVLIYSDEDEGFYEANLNRVLGNDFRDFVIDKNGRFLNFKKVEPEKDCK